jgi:hypothetical protein
MVHEFDAVSLRPHAREVGHHQFGTADAVTDTVLDVEADFHSVLLPPAGFPPWLLSYSLRDIV